MNYFFSLFDYCNCFTKRKLIAIFASIVLIAIGFLYFENIYNITHRSKVFFRQNLIIPNATQHPLFELSESQKSNSINSFINGKIIDQTSDKCWDKEKFVLVESCHRCDSLLRSSLLACKTTGYREIINCENHGFVSRSCLVPLHILRKHYWAFQFTSLFICLLFTIIAKRRKSFLDYLATEKVRRQILSA